LANVDGCNQLTITIRQLYVVCVNRGKHRADNQVINRFAIAVQACLPAGRYAKTVTTCPETSGNKCTLLSVLGQVVCPVVAQGCDESRFFE